MRLPNITTLSESVAYRARLQKQFDLCQFFEFTSRWTATKAATGRQEIIIGNEADFQVLGYNIEFGLGTSSAIDVVSLQLSQDRGNRQWSNDKIPIYSIATPGPRVVAAPPSRYGFRFFPGFAPANDKIKIDWENSDTTTDVEVIFTLSGFLLFK